MKDNQSNLSKQKETLTADLDRTRSDLATERARLGAAVLGGADPEKQAVNIGKLAGREASLMAGLDACNHALETERQKLAADELGAAKIEHAAIMADLDQAALEVLQNLIDLAAKLETLNESIYRASQLKNRYPDDIFSSSPQAVQFIGWAFKTIAPLLKAAKYAFPTLFGGNPPGFWSKEMAIAEAKATVTNQENRLKSIESISKSGEYYSNSQQALESAKADLSMVKKRLAALTN